MGMMIPSSKALNSELCPHHTITISKISICTILSSFRIEINEVVWLASVYESSFVGDDNNRDIYLSIHKFYEKTKIEGESTSVGKEEDKKMKLFEDMLI